MKILCIFIYVLTFAVIYKPKCNDMNKILLLLLFVWSTSLYSQKVSGHILDGDSGEALVGANVLVKNTNKGTVTDFNGYFELVLDNLEGQVLEISYLGFDPIEVNLTASDGDLMLGDISLEPAGVGLSTVQVIADYAVERKTPVAVAVLDQKKIERVLGSRDIPLAMNITPSVYATEQGGGAGDARINVRGFNQRNVAIMINGVPVNDMENGWVYWSNWDGVADATSSIQLQRGLSAVNLATPSIGGTMNIVTSPAEKEMGGVAKFEYGSGNFLKMTLTGHTGMINDKFALSGSVVRKVGNGIVDKTWTDAWAYYLGASYIINKNNKLEIFALAAPQRHGQNLYKQNLAVYDAEYAKSIDNNGYDSDFGSKLIEKGRLFNQNWTEVDPSYEGQQFWNGKTHNRHASDYINSRENFYNKPLVNLNYSTKWADNIDHYTVLYYSGGTGGGSGTIGSMYRRDANGKLGDDSYKFYYGASPWKYDFNEQVKANSAGADTFYVDKKANVKEDKQSIGILRNSRNNQTTWGAISKIKVKWNRTLNSTFGVDGRIATIDHFREVRDLLGGEYYMDNSDDFNPNRRTKLGDKIAYNFTNKVKWLGGFAQTEYSNNGLSVYGMVGYSVINYNYFNHFKKTSDGNNLEVNTGNIDGLQVKGGANYLINQNVNVFANLGYVSKVPIFDAVINDRNGVKAEDPKNEKFQAIEAGANFFSTDNSLKARFSGYYTDWKDRTKNVSIVNQDGTEGITFITGMEQVHAGLELDVQYKPISMLEIGFAGSLADWRYSKDVEGTYKSYDNGVEETKKETYYVKDLKVGDAPQTQAVLSLGVFPVKDMMIQLMVRHYRDFYADWDPFTRNKLEEDADGNRIQTWKAPNYTLMDLNFYYDLPLKSKYGVSIFGHVFNLTDALYVQDAVDNSRYNAYKVKDADGNQINSHTAATAEVFLGMPRRFNVGVKLKF